MRKSREDRINSQRYIIEAVSLLLQEHKAQDITVTDICKKAGVARVTFYKYYTSVFDAMRAAVEESFKDFFGKISDLNLQTDMKLIIEYALEDLYETRKILKNLIDTNMSGVLLQYVNHALESILLKQTTSTNKPSRIQFMFIAGGLFNIVLDWIEKGAKESKESLAEQIHEVLMEIQH
ncbi:TetR/AcrR family transcriptional regulator [Paenibacillus illinoisensis]|uniref:TetR/AcrR family transcriptional regulator n=1 Tax=Paenibacillus illinoisensis TaxID=59845 RepID=UPI003CF3898E